MLTNLIFVLGGAASGKSAFAEGIVTKTGKQKVYIATAQVWDDEMAAKVAHHRSARGDGWTTFEEPLHPDQPIAACTADDTVLLDCATLWLTNLILGDHDVDAAIDRLFAAITATPTTVVIVSNEVGYGIVPENALSRKFRNAQGRLNQQIAAQAATVVTVIAGLPLTLKGQL